MDKLHGELTQMAWPKYLTDPTDFTLSVLTTEVRFNYISKMFKYSKCTIKIQL